MLLAFVTLATMSGYPLAEALSDPTLVSTCADGPRVTRSGSPDAAIWLEVVEDGPGWPGPALAVDSSGHAYSNGPEGARHVRLTAAEMRELSAALRPAAHLALGCSSRWQGLSHQYSAEARFVYAGAYRSATLVGGATDPAVWAAMRVVERALNTRGQRAAS